MNRIPAARQAQLGLVKPIQVELVNNLLASKLQFELSLAQTHMNSDQVELKLIESTLSANNDLIKFLCKVLFNLKIFLSFQQL